MKGRTISVLVTTMKMTLDETLEHNKSLAKKIREREEQISELRIQIDGMKSAMIPLCRFCNKRLISIYYAGERLCSPCLENDFSEFVAM